jgi:hypothetical protein
LSFPPQSAMSIAHRDQERKKPEKGASTQTGGVDFTGFIDHSPPDRFRLTARTFENEQN